MNAGVIHLVSLVVELITLALLLVSQIQIIRLREERNDAIEKLMLYMDEKTREINKHHSNTHGSA